MEPCDALKDSRILEVAVAAIEVVVAPHGSAGKVLAAVVGEEVFDQPAHEAPHHPMG